MSRGKRAALQAGCRSAQAVAGSLRAKAGVSDRTARLAPVHRSEPNSEAARVLAAAHGLLKKYGWRPQWISETARLAAVQAGNHRASAFSLVEAIQTASNASIAGHHARQALQRLVGPVSQWEQNPLRIWRDVEQLLARAIEITGAKPLGRGNWRVGTGPWRRGEK